jgi:hypothetical protein
MPAIKLNFLTKLYVWSIIFEPLLFFIVFDQSVTGITGNISKLLQLLVVVVLILNIIRSGRFQIINPLNPKYRYYFYYFIAAIVSGLVGILQGSYNLNIVYEVKQEFSIISKIVNGTYSRPIFEYLNTIYYFLYFLVLPSYMMQTDRAINYFLKSFYKIFVFGIIVGFIDFILILIFNIEWIPRHIVDGVHVGNRFHGFAGEPRDAFVYLLLGFGIINLKKYWDSREFIGKSWFLIIFFTLLLTQSGSGLLGLLFSGVLMLLFSSDNFSIKKIFQVVFIALGLLLTTYIAAINSDRLMLYFTVFPSLWEAIGEGKEIPRVFIGQMSNIYPLWDLYYNLINLNFLPIIFGNGLGSASFVSNRIGGVTELYNPHSQLVRLLYEGGFLGVLLFVYAFLYPVRMFVSELTPWAKRTFIYILLLLLGGFFGHRSSVVYTYVGVFMVVFKSINDRKNLSSVI